jgi:hypothetical protein
LSIPLDEAQLNGVVMRGTNLGGARLESANLEGADLSGSNLSYASMVGARVEGAIFDDSSVYGLNAWDLAGTPYSQRDLQVTGSREGFRLAVDNLEVAQFVNVLLRHPNLGRVFDSVTAKIVLVLGRFTPERLDVLEELRRGLRQHGYAGMLFNFEGPSSRDLTETVSLLAHMAVFIVADLTEPRSIPQELQAIIPHLPSVPVIPLIQVEDGPVYGMFEHFHRYPWVLPVQPYADREELNSHIDDWIVRPAEEHLSRLRS